jgi:ribosomal protein S15P/S13E
MIQLTQATKLNRKGEEVDASLYLIHFDSRNLAIVEGKPTTDSNGKKKQNVIGYYSGIKHALQKSIDIAIKNGSVMEELSEMLQRINDLTKHIEELPDYPTMIRLLKGEL